EFWTDEKIVRLPFEARLLFIGSWNFADDHGCLPDEPERLRLEVLPGDHVDGADLLGQLTEAGLIERWETGDGRPFLRITRFCEHQKIDKRAQSRYLNEGSRPIPPNPADLRLIPPNPPESPQLPPNPAHGK